MPPCRLLLFVVRLVKSRPLSPPPTPPEYVPLHYVLPSLSKATVAMAASTQNQDIPNQNMTDQNTSIPNLNSLPRPNFPFDQQQSLEANAQTTLKEITERSEIWFRYLHDSEAYKSALEELCTQHEQREVLLEQRVVLLEQQILQQNQEATTTKMNLQERLIASLSLSNSTTTATSAYSSQSIKHPDPALYSGGRDELEPFITQLRTKLTLNQDHFEIENKKIFYASSRLEGPAMRQVMPHLKETGTDYNSVEELIATLRTAFGDPDRKATAQRELKSLRQRNTKFSTFVAAFQRWAPDTDFEQATLISFLSDAISQELKQATVMVDIPNKLDEYITLLQKADNRLRAIVAFSPFRRAYSSSSADSRTRSYVSTQASSFPATIPASTISTRYPSPVSIAPSDSASNLGYTPMDLSNAHKGPVPIEEKERRRALGLCSFCGGAGHGAPRCPHFKCYNCGKIGHGVASCRAPKKQRIQELSMSTDEATATPAVEGKE